MTRGCTGKGGGGRGEETIPSAPRTSSRLQLKLNQGVHIRFWPKHWNSCVTLCFHVQCVIKGSTNVDARWERLALCLRSRNLHSCTKTSRPQWHYLEAPRQQEARDSAGFSETVSQRFPAIAAKSTSSHRGTKQQPNSCCVSGISWCDCIYEADLLWPEAQLKKKKVISWGLGQVRRSVLCLSLPSHPIWTLSLYIFTCCRAILGSISGGYTSIQPLYTKF